MLILIDKPAGISSFGALARVRRKLSDVATAEYNASHPESPVKRKKVKVGHTGTLDPFATGLLILLTEADTKRANEFLKLDKVYEAEIVLGTTSSTGDPEGELTEHAVTAAPNIEDIKKAAQKFVGKITQKVPAFSAIKVNGERAYKLARAGKIVDTPNREVEIYNIEILDYAYPILKIRTHVSSGTYIRTLSEDIGQELGTGAYTRQLRRIKIGDYDIKDASGIEI